MSGLVDRWGRIGFALVTSLLWFLPMAAWAGSVDLQPGPGPWIAFGIGLVLLAAWLVMLTRLGGIPVTARPRRFDWRAMSGGERRWNLALFVFGLGLIGWLNGAATVDWRILASAHGGGPVLLLLALILFLVVVVAGVAFSWRRASAAYRLRRAGS